MRLLITGGAGFIGSHFVRYLLGKYPEYRVINLDKLTYAGNLGNVSDVSGSPAYSFVQGDIADRKLVDELAGKADIIINFAAETHVDNSIADPTPFLTTNVIGTQVLLEAALKHKHPRYIQISTDEVYGDIGKGQFSENSPLKPSSPYSASKAAGDMLTLAAVRTYGLPAVISRCSNNYGPYQYPEKVVPFFIKKLLAGENVPLYGDGLNVRDWLHVTDHCRAVDLVLHKGKVGEIYNVGANNEHSNLEITKKMLKILGLPEDRITFVKDRPGHDIRYAIDATKIRNELGWKPTVDFEEGFRDTVLWYKERFVDKL
ncbi:dTDP-glucose 4,6-dehydratase [Candidatus Peregrinibacteria bacterium]|nr:dTDP-glucose 4,6-dehydratase [Candidatus Peregrinibacteria bacterium]